jgi:hypothetical protein
MSAPTPESAQIVSARTYAQILTSRRLRNRLLPEGIRRSPYEILDYDVTLNLNDAKGLRATHKRSQRIRFLQNGVSGILDHMWGTGITPTTYYSDAGRLEDSFRDEGRRHLVLGLARPMGKGETLAYEVERGIMAGFTDGQEWFETTIDHPISRLRARVVFPRRRPAGQAWLHHDGARIPLRPHRLSDGRTVVRFGIECARPHSPYTIVWDW